MEDDAVALNVAVAEPDATVTEAGTVSSALLLESVTLVPPAGAVCVSVTVHCDDPPPLRLPELQVTEETEGIETEAPVADNETIPEPEAFTPTGFASPIDVVAAACVRVT